MVRVLGRFRSRDTARRFSSRLSARRLQGELLERREVLAVTISEFMASNQSVLADEDGDFEDWIELHNNALEPVNLQDWHLTDTSGNLTKWQFPAVTLAAQEHLVVFASGKNRTDAAATLHTNFRLQADGEYLALVQPAGVVEFEYAPEFPEQRTDISYGLAADGQSVGYFSAPTPGQPNVGDPLADPSAAILISEIMYHLPTADILDAENIEEEFIELFNRGFEPVNLNGWQISAGVEFTFPDVTIQPNGYLVVAADVAAFSTKYPDVNNIVGDWQGRLSNSSESIEIVNDRGARIDRVHYADQGDWARRTRGPDDEGHQGWVWHAGHDGEGMSLELINPTVTNQYGQNWTSSVVVGGTPGAANSVASDNLAPFVLDVIHAPAIPSSTETVTVVATLVDDIASGWTATLFWRSDGQVFFNRTVMTDDGRHGDDVALDGRFAGTIPPHPDRTILEFYVTAEDTFGSRRSWPAPVESSGAQETNLLYQVLDAHVSASQWEPGAAPIYYEIMTAAERAEFEGIVRTSDAQMNATFISVTGTGVDVRYNAGVRIRGSGSRNANPPNNRINIPSDNPWHGVTALNINVVSPHAQIAGSALFQLAGLPAATAKAVRLISNGTDLRNGFYTHVEPLNSEFAANHFPEDDSGNLYKGRRPNESPPGGQGAGLAYFGMDPAPYVSYTKLTNAAAADWSDVINLTFALNETNDDVYINEVESVANVDQWLRFLALNALLDNREGGLVNGDRRGDDYAAYRGIEDSRFVLIPHDLDSLFSRVDRSFFRSRGVPALNRLLNEPTYLRRYFFHLDDLIDNVLLADATKAALHDGLRHVRTPNQIDGIFSFLEQRAAFVKNQIHAGFEIDTGLPVVGGYPRTTEPMLALFGNADPRQTGSVRVNGRLASVDGSGAWSVPEAEQVTPIEANGEWNYLDDGSDQGTAWREPDFDDELWLLGVGPFGYGDGDENTVVNFGDDQAKIATTYFRRSFDVPAPDDVVRLIVRMRYDDGAAVYINGVEAVRTSNLPADATFATYANGPTPNERAFFDFVAPLEVIDALVGGENGIAVEVHVSSPASDDMKFDLQLILEVRERGSELIELNPGINRLFVDAFSDTDGTGEIVDRQLLDVWHDPPQGETVIPGGSISVDTTLTPKGGPYHVTGDVVVEADVELTILPGTTVYFDEDVELLVLGSLDAQGNEFERIRFTSVPNAPFVPNRPNGRAGLPDGPPRWSGIHFEDTMSADNVISFADIEYAQSNSGSVGAVDSQITVDNVTWHGTHLRMFRALRSSYEVSNSVFPDMFTGDESPRALGLDNVSEHIKTDGAIPSAGRAIIRNNLFGTNRGHNDVIDAVSGQRPEPILQVLDNTFLGSGDEALDLGGDVYVAGNLFMNVHRDDDNRGSLYSNAISTGDAGDTSTTVLARNIFWNVDHVIHLRRNADAIVENNTIVGIPANYVDISDRTNITSAMHLYVATGSEIPGAGAFVADNIFWDVSRVFGNPDQPAGVTSQLQFINNLTDPAIAEDPIATRDVTLFDLGADNLAGEPRFVDFESFALTTGSAGRAAGRFGQDLGAAIRQGIWITGEPAYETSSNAATLTVGGPGVFAFRYRVDGGPWSADLPIGEGFNLDGPTVRTATISLTNLAPGTHQVEVLGQDFAGNWQETPTQSRTWTVGNDVPYIRINELLANNRQAVEIDGAFPDLIELYNDGLVPINLFGYSLTDDIDEPTKYLFPENTIVPPNGYVTLIADSVLDDAGQHVGFSLNSNGDGVHLFAPAAEGGELIESVEFGIQLADFSIGRGDDGEWTLTQPTIGAANTVQTTGGVSKLRINEWLTNGDVVLQEDFVELRNADTVPVALGGLFLTDKPDSVPDKFAIAPLSYVAGSGFVAFIADEDTNAGANHAAFRLSADVEMIALLDQNQTELDRVLHFPQTVDVSQQGLTVDGSVPYAYFTVPTPGASNIVDTAIQHLFDGLRVEQLMYHPLEEAGSEFILLRNISDQPLQLAGVRIRNAVDFTFPDYPLAAGDYVLVVSDVAALVAQFGPVDKIAGTFTGRLGNGGDSITLRLPDPYDAAIQRFTYDDAWYPATDGGGAALTVVDTSSHRSAWSDRDNWTAARVAFVPAVTGDFDSDGSVTTDDIDLLYAAVRNGSKPPFYDLDGDGDVTATDVMFLLREILSVLPGDANLDGSVDITDLDIWSSNRFQTGRGWASADFNGDGLADGSDFNILVAYSQGPMLGDFNADAVVDGADIDALFAAIAAQSGGFYFDLDNNRLTNEDDLATLVNDVLQTRFGDANLDGAVDELDFGIWRQNRFAEDKGWAEGDFNGDKRVDAEDFLIWQENSSGGSQFAVALGPRDLVLAKLLNRDRRQWIKRRFLTCGYQPVEQPFHTADVHRDVRTSRAPIRFRPIDLAD